MTVVQKIIEFAEWYDGKREKKGNKGFEDPAFEAEMKSVGWYLGAPWCAFFGLLIYKKALKGIDKLYQAVLKQFNGSAKQTADNVMKDGVFETGDVPEEGAICIFLLGNGPSGHMGIVKKVDLKNNTMYLIEGNTNGFGSRDGEVVNANKARTIKREFNANGLNVYRFIYPRLKK